jgi:hypothetical protein
MRLPEERRQREGRVGSIGGKFSHHGGKLRKRLRSAAKRLTSRVREALSVELLKCGRHRRVEKFAALCCLVLKVVHHDSIPTAPRPELSR